MYNNTTIFFQQCNSITTTLQFFPQQCNSITTTLYFFPSNVTPLQQHYNFFPGNVTPLQQHYNFFPNNVTPLHQHYNFYGPQTDPNVTTSLNIFNSSLHCNYNTIFHVQQTQICPQTTIFLMSRSIVLITQPRV